MKIKIRPDDVSTPSGNEWAEMNGWLAELRDDSPEAPVDGSRTGPAPTGALRARPPSPVRPACRSPSVRTGRGPWRSRWVAPLSPT